MKQLDLDVEFETFEYESEKQLRVVIRPSAIADWCLGLVLLLHGLVDSVTVADRDYRFKLSLAVAADPQPVRSRATLWEKSCRMEVTVRELEYWLDFFLVEYRDGAAPVNHIDVETESQDGKSLTVTLFAGRFGPALSEDELREHLSRD